MAVYEKQVRLPSDVLEELGDHSGRWWSDPALEPVIVEAIRTFIKPAPAKRQQPGTAERSDRAPVRRRCAGSPSRPTTTSGAGEPCKALWKTPVQAEAKDRLLIQRGEDCPS
jgi:hypothetical protein